MKRPVLNLFLFVFLGTLVSSLSSVHASSPSADSVHFCAPFDYEQWRRDHPRPAAKLATDLNVGEPRTVRMIYFLPNDRPYRQEVVDSMKIVIRRVQTFYAEQMEAHGYGNKTFRFETDARGEPLVHRVHGQHPNSYYLDDSRISSDEIGQMFDLQRNIYLIVMDISLGSIGVGSGRRVGGVAGTDGKSSGTAFVPGNVVYATVAHELGHCFNLPHDFRDGNYIMSYGPGMNRLSACAANALILHPHFDPNIPIEESSLPTIEVISPRVYPAGSESISIQLEVGDSDGLHHVLMLVRTPEGGPAYPGSEVKSCRRLRGEEKKPVEFEYDGVIPSSVLSSLSDPVVHTVEAVAFDLNGDAAFSRIYLAELSPRHIATLEGHTGLVDFVVFSPNGKTVASGSWDGTVKLWDVGKREETATLEPRGGGVKSLAFSPDGMTLASGSWRGTVKLWDMATRAQIAVFEGHPSGVASVAFSSDGKIFASGDGGAPGDRKVRLWDVARRIRIATLSGHTNAVATLAFSPDDKTLASGSSNGTVKLWDVATGEETATLELIGGVNSLAFSPDGTHLAIGRLYNAFLIPKQHWMNSNIVLKSFLLPGTASQCIESVRFSPDGSTLAAGHSCGSPQVRIWDVLSGETIGTFPYPDEVRSVAFSPDGKTLASGSADHTVNLWDVSEWTRSRPFALEVVSGDGQRGAPGAVLTRPLVVEVRDQHGDPLPDAAVTFTVTVGEGKLSGRYSVERTKTDADGRAELTLTLDPLSGPNIVGVSLGGRDLATFTAEGAGAAVAELEGDYRTWHLPWAATARLGKGAMGESDRAVALSADGRYLAAASGIGVWLYEASTSRALALLKTASPVHSVAFSAAGTLASGLDNGWVALWDAETGTSIGTLRHADWRSVTVVVFSPDGTRLASGSWDQVIKVWDVEARREIATWEVPREQNSRWSHSVDFSPDGTRLASGFPDGTVRLWDVATRTVNATLEGHADRVTSVSFSPDGTTLASGGGGQDPTVRLWNAATQTEVATLKGHKSEVRSVAFSHDGVTMASGSSDGTVRVWNVAAQEEVTTLERHGDGIRSVTFSRDGATLVSATSDGNVTLREVETGNAVRISGHGSLTSLALSSDGVTLALGHQDGRIRLWDAARKTRIATLDGDTSGVSSVAFSSDGATLASGSRDRTVRLWDVKTREPAGMLEGHSGGVTSLTFSPNGAILVSAGGWDDATVRLWDVKTLTPIGSLEGHTQEVRSVSFSSDGALLASGGGYDDKTVRLWNVATRELIGVLEGHTGSVNAVAFSSNNALLASGSEDGITLWDVGTRQRRSSLNNRREVYSLAFSADGTTLATGTWGGATLWDVETREQIATLGGHTESVHSVAFSDDGDILATGASDGTMLLWDVAQYLVPSIPNPDFNGDGTVGFPDFLQFAAQFGLSQGAEGYDARFDLDANGSIGFSDFLIFAGAFGKSTS